MDNGVDCCHLTLICSQPKVGDVFIGYHADTAASITLQVCQSYNTDDELPEEQVLLLLTVLLIAYCWVVYFTCDLAVSFLCDNISSFVLTAKY